MDHLKPSVCLAVLSTKNKELCTGAARTAMSRPNKKYHQGSGGQSYTGFPVQSQTKTSPSPALGQEAWHKQSLTSPKGDDKNPPSIFLAPLDPGWGELPRG